MAQVKDFEEMAKAELEKEDQAMIVEEIKERLRELREAKKVFRKLEKKYVDFLEGEINDSF